jgi:hypothetical protein
VRAGGLQLSWNHDAAPVRNATSGSLTFQDGETRKTLQLNQMTARAGSVFYAARGTEVEVALTIFAPDHVVSESISAAVPGALAQSASSEAAGTGSEVLVASQDCEVPLARPEAEGPTRTRQTSADTQYRRLREPDHASPRVRDQAVAPGSSVSPISPHEEPAPAVAPVPEVAASDSKAKIARGRVAIRVESTGRARW